MRRPMLVLDVLAALCLLGASGAPAEELVYGPDGAPTVVQRKLYAMTGRTEVSLAFDVALNTALVDQLGGVLGVSYHPNYLAARLRASDWSPQVPAVRAQERDEAEQAA